MTNTFAHVGEPAAAITPASGRFCCKSRKSNEPENLAKGDFQRAVTSRSVVTPLRRSVVVFPRNDLVPHIVACNTRQRPRKCSFVTPKRLLQQNRHFPDLSGRPGESPLPGVTDIELMPNESAFGPRPGAAMYFHPRALADDSPPCFDGQGWDPEGGFLDRQARGGTADGDRHRSGGWYRLLPWSAA